MRDREQSRIRTVFRRYVVDDGWNLPEEVIEEMEIELTRRLDTERKRIALENRRHVGKWITLKQMNSYAARAWIYRELYSYQYINEVKQLGDELRREYGVTEVEAVNIVLGNEGLFEDYASKYYRIKNMIPRSVNARDVYEDCILSHDDLYEEYMMLSS